MIIKKLTFETVAQDDRVYALVRDHRDLRQQLKICLSLLDTDED